MDHMRGPLPSEVLHALRNEPVCLLTGLPERFAEKIEQPFSLCGCWKWKGWKSGNGYGRIRVKGLACTAHRVTYELLVGEIPCGLVLDHLCSERSCVNPFHLAPVPQQANVRAGDAVLFGMARYAPKAA